MNSIKLKITVHGGIVMAHPGTPRGYSGDDPVIEITGAKNVPASRVARDYARCYVLPLMHAEQAVPYALIRDAVQGQFVQLPA